jgi:hypothetical protein
MKKDLQPDLSRDETPNVSHISPLLDNLNPSDGVLLIVFTADNDVRLDVPQVGVLTAARVERHLSVIYNQIEAVCAQKRRKAEGLRAPDEDDY